MAKTRRWRFEPNHRTGVTIGTTDTGEMSLIESLGSLAGTGLAYAGRLNTITAFLFDAKFDLEDLSWRLVRDLRRRTAGTHLNDLFDAALSERARTVVEPSRGRGWSVPAAGRRRRSILHGG